MSTTTNGRYVTYKQLLVWAGSVAAAMIALLLAAWQIHAAHPHNGAVSSAHFNSVVEMIQADLADIKTDLRDIKNRVSR